MKILIFNHSDMHYIVIKILILCRDFAPCEADNLSPFIVRDVVKVE